MFNENCEHDEKCERNKCCGRGEKDGHSHHHWWDSERRHRAVRFRFTYSWRGLEFSGENMSSTLQQGNSISVIGSHPVDANNNPSSAVLSNVIYTSSDPTVFTVATDPATPNGAIITSVGVGTATLSATATATELSGATETISASDTIVITAVPPPPPPVAASFGFVYGTPFATPVTA